MRCVMFLSRHTGVLTLTLIYIFIKNVETFISLHPSASSNWKSRTLENVDENKQTNPFNENTNTNKIIFFSNPDFPLLKFVFMYVIFIYLGDNMTAVLEFIVEPRLALIRVNLCSLAKVLSVPGMWLRTQLSHCITSTKHLLHS